MTCRSKHTCRPATSDRGAGWPPAEEGVFQILAVKCVSKSSPFPVLVAVFWFRRTPLAVPTLRKEWWVTEARTAAIDFCSCLSHERSRRSLRRRALPVPPSAPSRAALGLPRGFDQQEDTQKKGATQPVRTWWWWWWSRRCVHDISLMVCHDGQAPNCGGLALHLCAGP